MHILCANIQRDNQSGQMFFLLRSIPISLDYVYYNRTVFIYDVGGGAGIGFHNKRC